MAIDYNKLNIRTKDGVIQNIKELCDNIDSIDINNIDINDFNYLESLSNKLANDNNSENLYVNEELLVNHLHELLVKYYIERENYTPEFLIPIIKIYNKKLNNLELLKNNNYLYFVYQTTDDIRVLDISNQSTLANIIKYNIKTFITSSSDIVFNLINKTIPDIKFNISMNDDVINYAKTFDLNDKIYEGKDSKGNIIYKIGNGLVSDNNGTINFIYKQKSFDEQNRVVNSKIEYKKNRHKNFDIKDFNFLRDKIYNGENLEVDEEKRFNFELNYLINTMSLRERRNDTDSIEYTSLEEYMEPLVERYNNNDDRLTNSDISIISKYLRNKERKGNQRVLFKKK